MRNALIRAIVFAATVALLIGSSGAVSAGPRNPLTGEGEGLKLVANIPYKGGTDMESATIKGRDYMFTGAANDGLRVIDITKPAKPKLVAYVACALNQADIQLSHDHKTLIMAADSNIGAGCFADSFGKQGFQTFDITNPKKPKPIGFAEIRLGSHNTTAHPTKPYVYNSDSELVGPGEIQIWSIADPAHPELVNTIPSVPHPTHDIGFSPDGNLAVTAAISHFDIFDTSDPENPKLLFTGQCPGCSITHDAKFTPDGKTIIIGDEGGGGLTYPCPGGGLYFYSFTNNVPVLTGVYEPDEFVAGPNGTGACTSHVFDISDDSKNLAISWYTLGTRYLDISSPTGAALGGNGVGVKELAWFVPEGGNSWSSKLHKGPYIYSNDRNRGFDVYEITAD